MFNIIKNKIKKINDLNTESDRLKKQNENALAESKELSEELQHLKKEIHDLSEYSSDIYLKTANKYSEFEINSIYALNGYEFEIYVSEILKCLNYSKILITQKSGDYGVDILAEKDNVKYAFQCKNYKNTLGNKSIQEIFSGKKYYDCDYGVVVTSGYFSLNAIQMAKKLGIILWDKEYLSNTICNLKMGNLSIIKNYTKYKQTLNKEETNYLAECKSLDGYEDPLYDEIVEFVIKSQKASASLLQRRFKLGYARAAKLIDTLEERKVIGPSQSGSIPREVLVKLEENN